MWQCKSENEENYDLGGDTMKFSGSSLIFQMKAMLPSSWLNIKLNPQQDVGIKPASYYLLGLVFDCEDGGSTFLQKISEVLLDYMASHPRTCTLHSHHCDILKSNRIAEWCLVGLHRNSNLAEGTFQMSEFYSSKTWLMVWVDLMHQFCVYLP